MTERACGDCSLCCKLAYIPELNKSIDSWCRHARPGVGGCSIYPDRPPSCRDFNCGWLVGARELGDEWFPARCKMIVTRREPRYNLQLLGWAQHMVIEIRVGRRCIRLNADGTEQQESRLGWKAGRSQVL